VLSAMTHGRDDDAHKASQIAVAAFAAAAGLDPDRMRLYGDMVYASLSEAVRRSLKVMKPFKYEYQSDFARKYVSEGEARGRAAVLLKQLQLRFGPLPDAVTVRVQSASIEELDAWVEQVLSATSLDEAFARHQLPFVTH